MSNALTTLEQLRSAASQSNNATAKVASAAAAALEEMHGLKADRATFVSFSVPITGWKTDSSVPGYTKYIDIKVDGLTAADSVGVDVDPSSSAVARAADSAAFNGKLLDGAGVFVKFHCHILQMPV